MRLEWRSSRWCGTGRSITTVCSRLWHVEQCSKCGQEPARPGQRWGRSCHAAWMRAHRQKHRELSMRARQKADCRAHTKMLQRRSALPRGPCQECGRPAQNWHDVTVIGRSQNGTCLACLKDAVRRSQAADSEFPMKRRCRAMTSALQRLGEVAAGPCEDCGKQQAENHHSDYTNPRLFIRLCRRCHALRRARPLSGLMSVMTEWRYGCSL